MNENTIDFSVVNASIYNTPVIAEVKRDKFVTFELGNHSPEEHNNTFFSHIEDCYNQSTTNKACINSIADYIYGKGLALSGKDGEPIEKGNANSKITKLNKIINAKDLKRIVKDRILYGQSAFQIIYKGVGNRKKVEKISHFPMKTLAMGKIREGDKKINEKNPAVPAVREVFYHPDWSKYEKRDKLTKFPTFGYGSATDTMEIYICKPYVPGMYYFSMPDYSAGLDYCRLEAKISEYQIKDIESGFSGTTLINIQRNIQDTDKRDYMVSNMMDKVSGVGGDKTLIFFNRNENEAVTLERFPLTDAPSLYEYLAQETARKILTSHRITNPKLLAVPTPGEQGLGNNADEVKVAAEMFQNLVVEPFQMEIIDAIEEIMEINDFGEELMFIDLEILNFEDYEEEAFDEVDETIDDIDADPIDENIEPNASEV